MKPRKSSICGVFCFSPVWFAGDMPLQTVAL
jgi:hypothetical protein